MDFKYKEYEGKRFWKTDKTNYISKKSQFIELNQN